MTKKNSIENKYLLERNLKLFYPFILSQRRLFYTLIGIYFLMLPGMSEEVQMLGWFMTAGAAASFIFEIPSGYMSDIFGHKRTLVLSKFLMIASTLLYIFAGHWIFFFLAAIFTSAGWAFQSGTLTAIVHNTMEGLDGESDFTKYFSKVRANISLVSAVLLVAVPFFTEINILIPFYIALVLDFIGLIAIYFIIEPSTIPKNDETKNIEIIKNKSIKEIFLESKKLNFLPFIFYSSFFSSIGYAITSYRELYLIDLGFPIIYIGFLIGLSRFVSFITGHFAHIIEEKISIRQLLFYKILYTSFIYVVIALTTSPYVVLILLAVLVGFSYGISSINQRYFLNNFISDKKYKATSLSIQEQVLAFFKIIFSLGAGYLMTISYSFGFIFAGVFTFVGGIIIWQFLKKTLK